MKTYIVRVVNRELSRDGMSEQAYSNWRVEAASKKQARQLAKAKWPHREYAIGRVWG